MKDHVMSVKELSTQELEDFIETNFAQLIRGLREAESRTCAAAEAGLGEAYETANAYLTRSLGAVYQGKGLATQGGLAMPDVTVKFGGK